MSVAALLAACFPAAAQTFTCAASSASLALSFGVYDPISTTPRTASANVTLTCTHQSGGSQSVNWSMRLSNGSSVTCAGASGRTLRRTGSLTDTIGYNVYVGSLAGGVWGNIGCGSFPSGSFNVTPGVPNNIKSVSQTLFGQIPVNQLNVAAGSYSDGLVLTISY